MKIGTRSVLFGAHQIFIHTWFVARAWCLLYGFPVDFRIWLSFLLHDLGYVGKSDMDGNDGERHVEWGARIMGRFGPGWRDFCLYHSRFRAKRDGKPVSRLCIADKLAIVLTPHWIYLPMAKASGELREYMDLSLARTEAGEPKYASMNVYADHERQWYADVQEYLKRWVNEHKDGKRDDWTPSIS